MLWAVWVSLALAATATAWRADPRAALAILGGLAGIKIVGFSVPMEFHYHFGAVLWLLAGGFVAQRCNQPLCGALLACVGLCYFVARVSGAPVTLGSWPFIMSEVFGVLAIAVAGGWHHGVVSFGRRSRLLDRVFAGRLRPDYRLHSVVRSWKGW